jgi:beta-galactosidase
MHRYISYIIFLFISVEVFSQASVRVEIPLLSDWCTIANDTNSNAYNGFENASFQTDNWLKINIPHNWDQYGGYRRMKHGNRHGYSWYRKKFFTPNAGKNKRYFLYFEGVGSYATIWINGIKIGNHAGGRTTFTLDVTNAIKPGKTNLLAVKADHPAKIHDLPWVCGGCSDETGFSEGSQPMGIFRPVQLIITNAVRIEPFGVHIWNDTSVNEKSATLYIETEIRNYATKPKKIILIHRLADRFNHIITETKAEKNIKPGETLISKQDPIIVDHPELWSLKNPYLYTLQSLIIENGKIADFITTPYGIRWISWPVKGRISSNQFLLNGKPVLINGTAEYEHNMGQSHAFSDEQIHTHVMQVKASGYNAFRDGHQPHNLRFQANWDSLGLLWWPQFAAHIWFDTPDFKTNFKQLLTDWVKERRNSPSVILWGLENESTLPTAFAEECCEIIRKLDPTTSSQRKITTCNVGTGTDWNVVQNWSGTYSPNPNNYGNEIKTQLLNGEYGAWRSIGLHTEGPFVQNGIFSEDRFTLLMESKIRFAESVKDSICGQFHWLLNSHDNPGRIQSGEGFRNIDRIGPVNYKGIITPWGEPTDAYYMFRSNYSPKETEPMVYIVSHTWPNRWISPGIKNNLIIYSNCDEVELFNDINSLSFGKKNRQGIGFHFQWDSVDIQYNVLYAVGYINGKIAATDKIILNHLPVSPKLLADQEEKRKFINQPEPGYYYIYRVNCGGPDYTDINGNTWLSDCHKTSNITWGSKSWTDDYPGLPAFFGSQGRTFNTISGTNDGELFQSFRYGRDKLSYEFPLPNGEYLIELYFTEPWYGPNTSKICNGWRLFDVAINGNTYLYNLDIQKEAGFQQVLKKKIITTLSGNILKIHFPKVLSGQAVISAIAIATKNKNCIPAPSSEPNIQNLHISHSHTHANWKIKSWMNIGNKQYSDKNITFNDLPPVLFGADWIQTSNTLEPIDIDTLATFQLKEKSDVYIALDARILKKPLWMDGFNDTKTKLINDNKEGNSFVVYTRRFEEGSKVTLGSLPLLSDQKVSMYTVAVVPVSIMEDAVDLRPALKLEAESARLSGAGLKTGVFDNKKYIQYSQPTNDTIEWIITPGVAGTYALNFRYINPTGKIVPMQLNVVDANGITILKTQIEFPATKPDKWRSINTSTGSNINAGIYKVSLCPAGTEGLWIDAMEVQ